MMKTSIFKYLISLCFIFVGSISFASTYVSLSPVITEIIYALEAEENLKGVCLSSDYPEQVKEKTVIGSTYFVNMEKLVSIKPDYLFALVSAKPKVGELLMTKTKPVYFEFEKIEDIYSAIDKIAKLVNKEENAKKVILKIKENINRNKTKSPKKILYLVQTNPFITIGNKSYLTDVIKKSGHISVTENISHYYPTITFEYVLESQPDVIVLCFPSDVKQVQKLLPNSKILYLNDYERDIINRPGPRVDEAVKMFSNLNFSDKSTR